VAVETNRYPVPYTWVGQDVTVQILFDEVLVHGKDGQLVRHKKVDGPHQVARWEGPPRSLPPRKSPQLMQAPRFDPELVRVGEVDVRALEAYESFVEVGE
jgi:hypothetical protein